MRISKILGLILLLSACGHDETSLDKIARNRTDSLFQLEYQSLIRQQDSICAIRKQMDYTSIIDSIVQVRKQQIIELQKGL